MVGWHHRLDGHEFERVPGVGDGQGILAYCSPWGHKELDVTELNFPPIPQIEGDLSLTLSSVLNVCPFGSADKESLN